jgi:hypothetical protein
MSEHATEPIDLDFDAVEFETDEAWLLVMDNLLKWLPKSQCSLDRDEKKVSVPEWLAIREGLV